MGAQPSVSAPAQSLAEETGPRKQLRRLIWHAVGVFDWLWLLRQAIRCLASSLLGWTNAVPLWGVIVLTVLGLGVHILLQKDKGTGCLVHMQCFRST